MLKLAAVQLYVQPLFLNAQFLISTDHYVSLSRGNVIFIRALKNSINGNPACYTTTSLLYTSVTTSKVSPNVVSIHEQTLVF